MASSMDHERTFTRQDVCQLARVPEEVFTFWVKRGLIVPVEGGAGKGSHRRFSMDQIRVACLIRAGRDAGLNITALSFIADRASAGIAVYRTYDMPHRYFLDVVSAACDIRVARQKGNDGHVVDFSYLRGYEDLPNDEAQKLTIAASEIANANPFDPLLYIGFEMMDATGYLSVSKNDDGSWNIKSGSLDELGKSTEATSDFYLVLSVGRIMSAVTSFVRGSVA